MTGDKITNIYANCVKRQSAKVMYIGINQSNNKTVCILSAGQLNHNGWIQIFAGNQGRWLMYVHDVCEVTECPKADYYYLCV